MRSFSYESGLYCFSISNQNVRKLEGAILIDMGSIVLYNKINNKIDC